MHWECAELYANEIDTKGFSVRQLRERQLAKSPFRRFLADSLDNEVVWHISVDKTFGALVCDRLVAHHLE